MIDNNSDSGVDSTLNDNECILIKVTVPELNSDSTAYTFNLDDTIWLAKLKVLDKVGKLLKDSLNYGLYMPPRAGKAGKFLEEERLLRDYPMRGSDRFLIFQYKRRVIKSMAINPTKLKQINSKSNQKSFMEAVKKDDSEKVRKLLNKGLDPNFYDKKMEETPLGLALRLPNPAEMIKTLVCGGAHLDFRTVAGFTAVHRAVQNNNLSGLKLLLDLGASANYRDADGLTPLYHAAMCAADDSIVDALLYDHAQVNIVNSLKLTELHQCCMNNLHMHVEYLLFYGADANATNIAGNTPLHICAMYDKVDAAQVLLRRGADQSIVNSAGQTALDVAELSQNREVAKLLRTFTPQQVQDFRQIPRYNDRRRRVTPSSIGNMRRTKSMDFGMRDDVDSSRRFEPLEALTLPRSNSVNQTSGTVRSLPIAGRSHSVTEGLAELDQNSTMRPERLFAPQVTRQFVCVDSYFPHASGEIHLRKGDLIEVKNVGDGGYWEGHVSGTSRSGWFPCSCVREVRVDRPDAAGAAIVVDQKVWQALFSSDAVERTVVLQRTPVGYGFTLLGFKRNSLAKVPVGQLATQRFLVVDDDGPAARAGILKGDYLLEVNGVDVRHNDHETVSQVIRSCAGAALTLKVLTCPDENDSFVADHSPDMGTFSRADSTASSRQHASLTLTASEVSQPTLMSLKKLQSLPAATSSPQSYFAAADTPIVNGDTNEMPLIYDGQSIRLVFDADNSDASASASSSPPPPPPAMLIGKTSLNLTASSSGYLSNGAHVQSNSSYLSWHTNGLVIGADAIGSDELSKSSSESSSFSSPKLVAINAAAADDEAYRSLRRQRSEQIAAPPPPPTTNPPALRATRTAGEQPAVAAPVPPGLVESPADWLTKLKRRPAAQTPNLPPSNAPPSNPLPPNPPPPNAFVQHGRTPSLTDSDTSGSRGDYDSELAAAVARRRDTIASGGVGNPDQRLASIEHRVQTYKSQQAPKVHVGDSPSTKPALTKARDADAACPPPPVAAVLAPPVAAPPRSAVAPVHIPATPKAPSPTLLASANASQPPHAPVNARSSLLVPAPPPTAPAGNVVFRSKHAVDTSAFDKSSSFSNMAEHMRQQYLKKNQRAPVAPERF